MELPKRAGDKPVEAELEVGNKYIWYTWGLSVSQPFCAGRHKASGMSPAVFTANKTEAKYLCVVNKLKMGHFVMVHINN